MAAVMGLRRSAWMEGPVFRRRDGSAFYVRESRLSVGTGVIVRHAAGQEEVLMGAEYGLSVAEAAANLRELARANGWVEVNKPE